MATTSRQCTTPSNVPPAKYALNSGRTPKILAIVYHFERLGICARIYHEFRSYRQ